MSQLEKSAFTLQLWFTVPDVKYSVTHHGALGGRGAAMLEAP